MISKNFPRRFCSEPLENIENYQYAVNDSEHMWECHHRLEIQGQFRNSVKLLKRCGMYWHRPASELIFLRHDVHRSLHHKGKQVRPDTCRKMSGSHMGHKSTPPDRSTPVEMTRISDGFTKVFSSQQEAAMWLANNGYPNLGSGHISCCCRGRRKTTGGCRWRYV